MVRRTKIIAKLNWEYVLAYKNHSQNMPRYSLAWWNVFDCYTVHHYLMVILPPSCHVLEDSLNLLEMSIFILAQTCIYLL